ncbi:Arginyl-tRNA synthetase, class Ic, core domain protein, partial [mine drainage metagenome]
PAEFATRLFGAFRPGGEIASASVEGAYVNFVAAPERIDGRTLATVFALGDRYGHRPPTAERACVEHTSANPTGPFHIGRVRNAIIGDTLARILRAAGTPVTTQYYVDDMGRQAAMISWIWGRDPAAWPAEIRAAVDGAPPAEKADARLG